MNFSFGYCAEGAGKLRFLEFNAGSSKLSRSSLQERSLCGELIFSHFPIGRSFEDLGLMEVGELTVVEVDFLMQ